MRKKLAWSSLAIIAFSPLFFSFLEAGRPGKNVFSQSIAPKISLVSVEPTNASGSVVYLSCAAITSKDDPSSLISVRATLRNNEKVAVRLTSIKIECSGNGKNVSKTYQPDEDGTDTIKAGKDYDWQNSRKYHELGDVLQIFPPYPTKISIKFFFDDFDQPFVITKDLKAYLNNAPGNGYPFPAKSSDLLMNEYWYGDAAHGGGGQVFAYDLVVMGWDEKNKTWSDKKQGKTEDKNENFRCYGKKVYSITDGEILSYINDWQEAPSTSDTGTKGGNSLKINNGKETICYYHFQEGSLNKNLLKIGAKVKKGDFLALAGNSGNSSGPHIHVHAIWDPDKDGQGPFIPLQFSNMYAIDIKALTEPDPKANWVKLAKAGLPYVADKNSDIPDRALLWPDSRKPCWYPYDLREIARHGVPESSYQAEIEKIWSCGYYPVWVDAYDVGGKTFFNAVFRYNQNNYDVVARHNMTRESFQDEYSNWVGKKGYRLQQVDNYLDQGSLKFAAIFIKRPGQPNQQPAYHGASPEDHQKLFDKYSADGFVPVNVSVTSVNGKRYYSAFYEKRNVGKAFLKSSLTQDEYQDLFNEMKGKKWEQVYINAYHHDGKTRFSVIWYERSGYSAYSATRRSDPGSYQESWEDNLANGFLTRCITGYDEGGKHWFAAYWAK